MLVNEHTKKKVLAMQAQMREKSVVEVEEDDEDDDDESLISLPSETYDHMMTLLNGAMRMLGFYGDRDLSGNIVVHDRKRMLTVAEELRTFIDTQEQFDEE